MGGGAGVCVARPHPPLTRAGRQELLGRWRLPLRDLAVRGDLVGERVEVKAARAAESGAWAVGDRLLGLTVDVKGSRFVQGMMPKD